MIFEQFSRRDLKPVAFHVCFLNSISALFLFVESLDYKVRKDLSINFEGKESMSIEICNGKTRNMIFNSSTDLLIEPQKL